MTVAEIRHGLGTTCTQAQRLVELHQTRDSLYTWWTRGGDSERPYAVVRGPLGDDGTYVVSALGDEDWLIMGQGLVQQLTDGGLPPEAVFDDVGGE